MGYIYNINFSIKRFEKSADTDFIKAMNIYSETTPIDIKTNTNEICYWLEKKNYSKIESFISLYFALYCNEELVGFAMISYLKKIKTAVIEYISLKDEYRNNSVFFPILNLLIDYLSKNNFEIDYFINEISYKNNGKSIDKESKLFNKMICMEGFGKINAPYYTLPLGNDNFESNFEAYMYIKTRDNINSISVETYLKILKAIYFDYYIEWYRPFLNSEELNSYKDMVKQNYDKIYKQVQKQTVFEVTKTNSLCPLTHSCDYDYDTSGVLKSKKKPRNIFLVIISILLIIFIPIIIIFFYNFILKLIGIEINAVNSAIGGIFGATLSFLASFYINKKKKN